MKQLSLDRTLREKVQTGRFTQPTAPSFSVFPHLRFPTLGPRRDDPDRPVVGRVVRDEAPSQLLLVVALRADPVAGVAGCGLDLRVGGGHDGVVAGVGGEVEHAAARAAAVAGGAAAVLLELRVDEEGGEDAAEQQEDAAEDGAHVRDLTDATLILKSII